MPSGPKLALQVEQIFVMLPNGVDHPLVPAAGVEQASDKGLKIGLGHYVPGLAVHFLTSGRPNMSWVAAVGEDAQSEDSSFFRSFSINGSDGGLPPSPRSQ